MPDREDDYLRALDTLSAPPDSPTAQALGPEVQSAIEAARPWFAGPNVVGAGVTTKLTSGNRVDDQWSLAVYVNEKLPESYLDPKHLVPQSVGVPGIGDGLVTDVIPIGKLTPQVNTSRVRPLLPGYSVGLMGTDAGTLGWVVAKSNAPDVPLLLSNSHVIAGTGLAAAGADIVQPGKSDGGGEGETVGTLFESVPFDFTAGYNNLCDAALASILQDQTIDASIPGIGVPTYDPAVAVRVGMGVQKTGRTTGYTTGIVQDVHFRTLMLYPKPTGGYGNAGFRDQILCTRYSDSGDSGSLVCDMEGKAVGLHWCGSQAASIFSPLSFVFGLLDLTTFVSG